MKSLLVLYSYHHNNTQKVAEVIAKILNAKIKTPQQINPEELLGYELVGFGSGIYGEKHHRSLLDLADRLPEGSGGRAFLFSTAALTGKAKVAKDHSSLRGKLESRGYAIVGEFGCKGFNTNSFMKYLGGMNRGRPNSEDLKNAEEFARTLRSNLKNDRAGCPRLR
jgi:flavodoxin